jgi:chaperonin cofactor prefoldin
MQASECHERESQSLLSRLDAAQLAVTQLQSDHRSWAIAMSATNDQHRQVDAEQLRSQLESKYGEHLERVKEQYEGRVNRLQMQLTSLHTQLQSMEGNSNSALGGLRNSHSTTHYIAAAAAPTPSPDPLLHSRAASGSVQVQHTVTESAIAYEEQKRKEIEREREREKEDLEKRIRQAEARSIALTQQLQSMPSCLQVRYTLNI